MLFESSLFSSLILWLVIWLMTKREGGTRLLPILLICLVTTVVAFLLFRYLGEWGLPIVLVALVLALVQWCFLPVWKAIIAAVTWFLCQMLFRLLVGPIF